uniref:non-specific serine/threonine protein kinase n=1 Tax=Knipowitschia caucasica TaxID=637954 RepID=A0AAV2KLG5_KNICA
MKIHGVQLLKSPDLGRHSLLYLKEIGHGWFGKVMLGEVNAGHSTTQVVVKELKASASAQEQSDFLEEVQPYRLQHPALVMCLAQCTEVTPYLLIMEFCPLGDLKNYLRSCRGADADADADAEAPDPSILQRMVCDIASGLLHLHKQNFIHSDLALRNCLLTSELSVKIGDYGLSHSRYKEDYYITQDQIWVPLRWIAPELIDEVHGNLLVVDQTKNSNIWSLGVTMWELFELGNLPYRQFSDRQVLTYALKEEQLKLPKPHLQFPLSERWYEVMQFCWLQPELRPSSEEVHLLVTYLCAKGSSEAEEDFEQRWNALRPNLLGSNTHTSSAALVLTPTPLKQTQVELASSASSFPLLEHFPDSGDDLLTVTETSQGLNFEYKWEQARAEQPYCSSSTSGPLGQGNPHYQDIYYSCRESTCRGDSPTYYEPEHPGVVPVLSAHSPSISSEYYIRIEEPVECNITLDDSIVDYSPGLEACSVSPETASCKAQDSNRELHRGVGVTTSLVGLGDYSEDEDDDLTYITAGIFADFNLDYANLEEEELSPIKHTHGTPGSVDTLNLSSSMEQAFSPDNFNIPLLPKSLDSGYDTENNESPEFLFKDDQSPRIGGDFVLEMDLGQEISSNIQLKALTDKSPYRDSAYFSDYENERSPHKDGSRFFPNSDKTHLLKDVKFNYDVQHTKANVDVDVNSRRLATPGLSMLSPFPPEMGGCLTKECAPVDEELGLETDHSPEELPSELSSSMSEPSSSVQEGSSHQEDKKTGNSLPNKSLQSNCTLNEDTTDGSAEDEEIPEISSVGKDEARADVTINEDDFEDIDADSQDSLCEEPSNGPANLSTSSSLLELCGEDVRAPLEEAEEEYDSDDSESDEELRTYNIQEEDSDESEEDFSAVPVVFSDCSRASHLRSLLKMPTLLTESFCEELDKKKKAVSFFDDVTVFLFDQESPTGELSDYTFVTDTESLEEEELPLKDPETPMDTALEPEINDKRVTNELEDVVCEPNLPSPNDHPESLSCPVPSPTRSEVPKPSSVALNRFMVSRFSITHVIDPNASSVAETIDGSPN